MGVETLINTLDDRYVKQDSNDAPGIVFGQITSLNPIELRLANSQQVITSNQIRLSSLVRSGTPGGEGLRVRDEVIVLKVNGGQLFYVLEKRFYQPVRHCTCDCDCGVS